MRIFFLSIIIAGNLFFSGCTDENAVDSRFRLKEYVSGYAQSGLYKTFSSNSSTIHCCVIEYKNGKVSKVTHKNSVWLPMSAVEGFSENTSIDSYHEYFYEGNSVEIIWKVNSSEISYTPDTVQLTLDDQGRIIKKINCNTKDTTTYFYSESGLLNKSVSYNGTRSSITRTFFFDSNNNLVSINGEIESGDGNKTHVNEYFEEFDTGINGFKESGIIEGAFIRSLSQNNFNVYTSAIYHNNILIDSMMVRLPVTYSDKDYPVYGNCLTK